MIREIRAFVASISKFISAGGPIASEELVQKRCLICQKCPHLVKDTCQLCNCYIPAKIWLQTENCPELRW